MIRALAFAGFAALAPLPPAPEAIRTFPPLCVTLDYVMTIARRDPQIFVFFIMTPDGGTVVTMIRPGTPMALNYQFNGRCAAASWESPL